MLQPGIPAATLCERYEGLGDDPFIVPLDPSDARVISSAWLYAKERRAAITAELPPVA